MKILVINTGSSSIKFKLFEAPSWQVIAEGIVEKIGESSGKQTGKYNGATVQEAIVMSDHAAGMHWITGFLLNKSHHIVQNIDEIKLVGHRVVHGGDKFTTPVVINQEVKETISSLIPLAPLHNPANLKGIEEAEKTFPHARQVAVFDTAFHQSLPAFAYRYAIPEKFYSEDRIRVYGFHGTSHQYVSREAARYLQIPEDKFNAISIHLGNGASMSAIRNGQSIDTTLGLSPLPGLVMGTRSGDIDPTVIFYLHNKRRMDVNEIDHLLNKESGLKGIAGTNDMREITSHAEKGDTKAELALQMFTYRIKKYIGAYYAIVGRLDAVLFTAGIGENSALVRAQSLQDLGHLGLEIDQDRNHAPGSGIQSIGAGKIPVLIVPTNEERTIAEQSYALMAV